jgi:hypothetical protein
VIDFDTFDQYQYFPTYYHGNCIAIALALHRLTGWPLYSLYAVADERFVAGHAVGLSPRGFFDLYGFYSEKQFMDYVLLSRHPADIVSVRVHSIEETVEDIRDQYLSRRDHLDIENHFEGLQDRPHDAELNLEMAIPVAEALLQRYWSARARQLRLPLRWPAVMASCSCGDCAICGEDLEPIRVNKLDEKEAPF